MNNTVKDILERYPIFEYDDDCVDNLYCSLVDGYFTVLFRLPTPPLKGYDHEVGSVLVLRNINKSGEILFRFNINFVGEIINSECFIGYLRLSDEFYYNIFELGISIESFRFIYGSDETSPEIDKKIKEMYRHWAINKIIEF